MPLAFSVLLPFKNSQRYITECLESLRNSSLRDFEVLMVDDHSGDGSPSIAKMYSELDGRFKLIQSETQGLVSALNTGLKAAKAKYIARMDSDDISHPERFEKQYFELVNNPGVTLTACQVKTFSQEPLSWGHQLYMDWVNRCQTNEEIHQGLLIESPLVHPSVMFQREAVVELGGYIDYDGPEDYDLWLRLKEAGHQFSKLKDSLLYWRVYPESFSRTDNRYNESYFEKRKFRHLLYLLGGKVFKDREFYVFGAGKKGGRLGRFLLKNNLPLRGFGDIDPAKQGGLRHGLPVLTADQALEKGSNAFFLSYVTGWGAREMLTKKFESHGKSRNRDFYIL